MQALNNTRWWSDIMAEEEDRQATRLLRMSAAEWKAEGTRMIRGFRGRDVRPLLAHLDRIDRDRAAYAAKQVQVVVRPQKSEFDVDFAIWRDMIEEPAKYGDDIIEWLELDEKLTRGAGRWRLGAYWTQVQAEEDAAKEALSAPWRKIYSKIAKQAAIAGDRAWVRRDIKRHVARFRAETLARETLRRNAATVIAAAVRGHQARCASPVLDCCMCLSHRISPIKTDVGMMCRECWADGPYTDVVEGDPWNWFRAEGVDLAPSAKNLQTKHDPCRWCTAPLDERQIAFCDADCEYSYNKETWKDMRDY